LWVMLGFSLDPGGMLIRLLALSYSAP
jgi:hypothetical protein